MKIDVVIDVPEDEIKETARTFIGQPDVHRGAAEATIRDVIMKNLDVEVTFR